ncbi:MAG: HNH endonuclease [Candidatus Acidiferrales bacterium]
MESAKPTMDVAQLWAEVEERLAPMLRLDEFERAVYYYLLSKTHVKGWRTTRITAAVLARVTGRRAGSVSWRKLQTFFAKGCVRILENHGSNSLVWVLTPSEVLGRLDVGEALARAGNGRSVAGDARVRRALLARESGRCYYCFRVLREKTMTVDHVVPLCAGGADALENVVACCFPCNLSKGAKTAAEFLRLLYRREAITAYEMRHRLEDLKALAEGQRTPRHLKRAPRKKRPAEIGSGGDAGLASSARLV